MPDSEALRLGSALIMGIAVCATHYSGMGAASYTVSEENYVEETRFLLQGKSAAEAASNGSLLVCYWLASFSVVRSARLAEMSLARSADKSTMRDVNKQSAVSVGRDSSNNKGVGGISRGPSNGIRQIFVGTTTAMPTPDAQV